MSAIVTPVCPVRPVTRIGNFNITINTTTKNQHERDNFGLAQAKLFDAYFKFNLLCLAVAGFTAAALPSASSAQGGGDDETAVGATPFLVALASVVANLVFFSPQTTITMMERRRVCKELGVERTSKDPRVNKNVQMMPLVVGL